MVTGIVHLPERRPPGDRNRDDEDDEDDEDDPTATNGKTSRNIRGSDKKQKENDSDSDFEFDL